MKFTFEKCVGSILQSVDILCGCEPRAALF